uniref:LysM peptidoglycan-binding domain-containing protein n=1 Tax=Clostridium sp. NkU-1 TaxID=1095009 RepID=UPI0006D142FC
MIIHVVQPGETINSISDYYKIPVNRLILENGITNPGNLAIGQTRNNPYLSDREFMYAGETIVISYQTNKTRTIATSGYAFPYIDKSVLIKTLPFLSYLDIFNYRATSEGEIVSSADDTELVNLAKIYGVAPMMFVSTITEEGIVSREVAYNILNNPSVQDRLIDNALHILKTKGFYGINVYVENITYDNLDSIAEYLKKSLCDISFRRLQDSNYHNTGYVY